MRSDVGAGKHPFGDGEHWEVDAPAEPGPAAPPGYASWLAVIEEVFTGEPDDGNDRG